MEVGLGIRVMGTGLVSHEMGSGNSGKNPNDSNDDKKLYQGKTVTVALITDGKYF